METVSNSLDEIGKGHAGFVGLYCHLKSGKPRLWSNSIDFSCLIAKRRRLCPLTTLWSREARRLHCMAGSSFETWPRTAFRNQRYHCEKEETKKILDRFINVPSSLRSQIYSLKSPPVAAASDPDNHKLQVSKATQTPQTQGQQLQYSSRRQTRMSHLRGSPQVVLQ